MIVSTDTQNKEDVKNTIKVLEQILKMDLSTSEQPASKKETKPKKKKEPEPDLEIEDDEDIFDDDSEEKEESIKEYTEADVKKALTTYAKENDQKAAKKILKQYSATGKLADVDSDDYTNLIADLV